MKTTVFIVDDHYMVIEGIRSLLQNEADIEWMGHATSVASCLSFLQHRQPDVVFMDINLPDGNGIDLCGEVKRLCPSVFIIGLSTFNQQSFVQRMMAAGASGYVLKNATLSELKEAIAVVMKGKLYLSREAAAVANRTESEIILTRREKEVLALISDGLTNAENAQKIFLSTSTVDTHRKNLLAKFEARNIASLIKTAVQKKMLE